MENADLITESKLKSLAETFWSEERPVTVVVHIILVRNWDILERENEKPFRSRHTEPARHKTDALGSKRMRTTEVEPNVAE